MARIAIVKRLRTLVAAHLTWAIIFLIRFYQSYIRPHLIGQCKYYPSCSEYAIAAVRRRGPVIGTLMAVKRVLRCHPFARGGYDPVRLPKRNHS